MGPCATENGLLRYHSALLQGSGRYLCQGIAPGGTTRGPATRRANYPLSLEGNLASLSRGAWVQEGSEPGSDGEEGRLTIGTREATKGPQCE